MPSPSFHHTYIGGTVDRSALNRVSLESQVCMRSDDPNGRSDRVLCGWATSTSEACTLLHGNG